MREKIWVKGVSDGILQHGKRYGIDVYASPCTLEFVFSRGRQQDIEIICSSGLKNTTRISRRKLKQLINDTNFTRSVFEIEDK